MIKSNLPSILSKTVFDDAVEWLLDIPADLPYFSGHFPEQPVLPGVTQLDWAVQIGANEFGYVAEVESLEVLKFQQLILPNTQIKLKISLNASKHKLIFTYYQDEQSFGSGRVTLSGRRLEEHN